jgi:hypothetical protein
MIIWRGWGVLALIIMALTAVAIEGILEATVGLPNGIKQYRVEHPWVWLVSFGLAAVFCWFTGTALERRELKNAKIVTDKETGQDIRLIGRNDMFWIPVKWWSVVYVVLAIVFMVSGK